MVSFVLFYFLFDSFKLLSSGDLTKPLVLSTVAAHNDKIIQARWFVNEFSLFDIIIFFVYSLGIQMICHSSRAVQIEQRSFGLHRYLLSILSLNHHNDRDLLL